MSKMPKGDYTSNKDVIVGVNYPRVKDFTLAVAEMNKTHPLFQKQNQYPDAIVPRSVEKGSLDHALHIFYSCSLDSMRRADSVYSSLGKLSEKTDLKKLHRLSEYDLHLLLVREFGNVKMGNPIQTLMVNSRKLHKEYKGDPRNIVSRATTIEEINRIQERVMEFDQYGLGKSALLIKNFVRFGWWDFPEHLLPIKIDRHAIRIALGTELVQFYTDLNEFPIPYQELRKVGKVRSESLVKLLQPAFQVATKETQVSAIALDDSMWLIGSRMCHRNSSTYCRTNCSLNCKSRPFSDNTATVFFPGTERRKHIDQKVLF